MQIVTYDSTGITIVWDAQTGKQLPTAVVPPVQRNDGRTPDGQYLFLPSGDRVIRYSLVISEEDRLMRLGMTRPDPEWHALRAEELTAEKNTYGAALHRAFAERARGVFAFEDNKFQEAWVHFLNAAVLMPPPPAAVPMPEKPPVSDKK
jgi:hypothetical protein